MLHHKCVRGDQERGYVPPPSPSAPGQSAEITSPSRPPNGGHVQQLADVAAGPVVPRARSTTRRSNRGSEDPSRSPNLGPQGLGCRAARHWLRAGGETVVISRGLTPVKSFLIFQFSLFLCLFKYLCLLASSL